MAKKQNGKGAAKGVGRGNSISEWFGQRIYPAVKLDSPSLSTISKERCPFLSSSLASETKCVKNENSLGVCTISSTSNGKRQDWLACPYRVIDTVLVAEACAKIFGLSDPFTVVPATVLSEAKALESFKETVRQNGSGFVFFQDKLGGEISVLGSPHSPELQFDITLLEVVHKSGHFILRRFGFLEIQTMDFHGSYKHAVGNLRDGYRLHKKVFPKTLAENLSWAGDRVEGPNIANVFKRTFYQMMLKFELGGNGVAAGTVLALPEAVWDSWQPFLGKPTLEKSEDGLYRIASEHRGRQKDWPNAYICIFDLDDNSESSVTPLEIKKFIHVSPTQLADHAFKVVPQNILASMRGATTILSVAQGRLKTFWPEIEIGS